ncbi:hypothetical protein JYB62_02550 [Algoriphagus lutimaris]|uniref:hypothetical protein n=1 Tax=Algoriphagus lutimaris TaxID=613197 RepID=UPI00196ABDE6|nr:hypothetical protein [Algoriphagus lutimaris]MBN3518871.1 hypothetical protein [Algoriphagus lutimaris]
MNYLKKPTLLIAMMVSLALASCKSEDPVPENDEELITDVTLRFTEVDASGNAIGTPFEFVASDPQGVELGDPTIETVELVKGKSYQMEIFLYNSIADEDITEEVQEESDEHQFYFLGTAFVGSPVLTYTYDDLNGEIIGLKGQVEVAEFPGFNNANMRIILRHDLDKNFPGADNPNFENFTQAGGETDLDLTFPLVLN